MWMRMGEPEFALKNKPASAARINAMAKRCKKIKDSTCDCPCQFDCLLLVENEKALNLPQKTE